MDSFIESTGVGNCSGGENTIMILKITLDLPEDDAYLRMTRELGRSILTSLQAVSEDIDDIDTVISELYSNVLRHGHSEAGHFQVVLEYRADRMVVKVVDRGKGFSMKNVAPPGTMREDFDGAPRIGGFGLELVRALSTRLEFQPSGGDGTTVRAEKMLRYQTVDAADEAKRLDMKAKKRCPINVKMDC